MAASGGEDDETVLSLADVVAEEDEAAATARAVLGPADVARCTYPQGYASRQPLYACQTCAAGGNAAGVCLACSLECHDGHELVELYTKRHFRCDCGNGAFPKGFRCRLEPEKDESNAENAYGQNFKGVYCVCSRPYPDEDDDSEDTMVQCCVCEDWFHTRHLTPDGQPYDADDVVEMACRQCVDRLPFLAAYCSDDGEGGAHVGKSGGCDSATSAEPEPKETCRLSSYNANALSALFWKAPWRHRLCRCSQCTSMYEKEGCAFLCDENDTVAHYESQADDSETDLVTAGMTALQGVDRSQRVEMLHEYNELKDGLGTYLKRFADDGTVVTERHIRDFFENLSATKKRPRLEPPDTCR